MAAYRLSLVAIVWAYSASTDIPSAKSSAVSTVHRIESCTLNSLLGNRWLCIIGHCTVVIAITPIVHDVPSVSAIWTHATRHSGENSTYPVVFRGTQVTRLGDSSQQQYVTE